MLGVGIGKGEDDEKTPWGVAPPSEERDVKSTGPGRNKGVFAKSVFERVLGPG